MGNNGYPVKVRGLKWRMKNFIRYSSLASPLRWAALRYVKGLPWFLRRYIVRFRERRPGMRKVLLGLLCSACTIFALIFFAVLVAFLGLVDGEPTPMGTWLLSLGGGRPAFLVLVVGIDLLIFAFGITALWAIVGFIIRTPTESAPIFEDECNCECGAPAPGEAGSLCASSECPAV